MSPPPYDVMEVTHSFPRVSGDEPESTTGGFSSVTFSPRERG